ncbi:AraC family transcriptional regulator [Actinoplanes sp. TFC3]|uniref:helix-turn-helix transcriptional regulator n=1 Tax=Actinoplanes sp. TFC3 TaxID=1710355 RepID=UPI00082FAF5C|nr:AraC family transcriptional regulator [Actinoplanes sp. TFC3]
MADPPRPTATPPGIPLPRAVVNSKDIDQTRSLLNDFYYPITVGTPQGLTGFSLRFDVIQLGPLTVGRLGFGTTITLAADDLDAYHVVIPTYRKVWSQHAGHRVVGQPGDAVVFGPHSPVFMGHDPLSTELSVKIERPALEAELAGLLGRPVPGPIALPPRLDLTTGPLLSWSRLVSLLRSEIMQPSTLLHQPIIVNHLRHSVLGGLLLSAPHRYSEELTAPAPAAAPRAIRTAMDAINAEPERPFTVVDLAGIAGISVRSLQEGFQRYVGPTPMTYLKQVRLTRAHEALRQADPAYTTVAAVAHRWGFAHLGRFASQYRARFGSNPSTTLHDRSLSYTETNRPECGS